MTFLQCLDDDFFFLPKNIGKEHMKKYLENAFEKYFQILGEISDETLARELRKQNDNLRDFCKHIITSLVNYQKGNTWQAYSEFRIAMTVLYPFLFSKGGKVKTIGLFEPFYRARGDTSKPLSKSDMFHLPFSKREFANTQRFSIPGLPCLYLSSSIYVCWEELNRPALNDFQVSRFQQENFNLKVVDISNTPTQLKWHCKSFDVKASKYDYDYLAFRFLLIWPLSIICSLSVLNEDAPFKHEYIFSQFLLQWVTHENDIDGIKYFSVKSNPFNREDFMKLTNYVFPPKDMDNDDYCMHLKKSFKLTEPISAETFKISDPNLIFITDDWLQNVKYKVMIAEILELELIKDNPMPYTHTLFGKMELFMQNLEVDFLK